MEQYPLQSVSDARWYRMFLGAWAYYWRKNARRLRLQGWSRAPPLSVCAWRKLWRIVLRSAVRGFWRRRPEKRICRSCAKASRGVQDNDVRRGKWTAASTPTTRLGGIVAGEAGGDESRLCHGLRASIAPRLLWQPGWGRGGGGPGYLRRSRRRHPIMRGWRNRTGRRRKDGAGSSEAAVVGRSNGRCTVRFRSVRSVQSAPSNVKRASIDLWLWLVGSPRSLSFYISE